MGEAPEVLGGRYELGEVLGRGGMGEVRAAQDRRLGRTVAVKLLHRGMADDTDARRRFEGEALAAAQLVHPNVVGVFDTGEHAGTPYIVMECLPGRSLADEIAAGPLPLDRVRTIAHQVLAAVGAAHDAGVIHRDIKPGNVLLTTDGTAKVADFGIAKTTEGSDHTATGMVIGTPSYLAPERVLGEPATERSDLYAVGVVLYEALTGTKPFADRTPLAAAAAIQHEVAAPVAGARPDADAALVGAVERAMAKDPGDRFASAAEMAAAISPQASAAPPPTTSTVLLPAQPTSAMPAAAPPHAAGPGSPSHAGRPPGAAPPGPTPYAPAPPGPARQRSRGLPVRVVAALVGVSLLVLLLLLLVTGGDDRAPGAPAGEGPELPGVLEERVRDLEEAVQP